MTSAKRESTLPPRGERKPYKLPAPIIQRGELRQAGETVNLYQDQIERIEAAVAAQAAAGGEQ
jgi:hypothetical protein